MSLSFPQSSPVIAWDGTISVELDLRGWTYFGIVVGTKAAITADAVFNVMIAPPSLADPCLPGTFVPFLNKSPCAGAWVSTTPAQIVIKVGTPKCQAFDAIGLPCTGSDFIKFVPSSGQTADVTLILNRDGKN